MNKIFKSMMAMSIAAFTFTACEDVPEPYNNPYDSIKGNEPVVVDPKGSGTAEDPWNVTALVNACEGLAANEFLKINGEEATVYVTGVVVETTDISTNYKNATYYIADDKNGVARFYVFRGKMLNGADVTTATDLEVGDEVTVCGKVKNYVDKNNVSTLEFDQGNYLVSLKKANGSGNTETPDVKTVGSKDAPKTVAEALTAINSMENGATSEEYWFIKGKVKQIITAADKISQYKNIDYLITDDGNNEIKVFRGKNLDNTDFTSADQLAVDDEVVIYGQLLKYEDTKNSKIVPEVAQGNYIVKKSSNSGNNNGDEAKAVTVAEFNAAAESTDVWYKLTGTIKNLKDGDQYGNFNLEDATGSVYVYGVLSEKGGAKKKFQELVTKYGLKDGMTITIIGNRGSYTNKNTGEVKIEVMNAYFVSVGNDDNGNNNGNGTGVDGSTIISVSDFNAAAESNDVWYQLSGTIKNLKDGDQYGNFDLEDATGSVYVYGVLSEKGGAKKKFQELVAAKGIANGKKITIVGNRGSYTNKNTGEVKIEVMNAYFVSVE